jgi:hypothetical protein
MAKAAKILCDRCESRITAGDPFCGSCGHPTTWASHDERAAWEVARYREKVATAPISSIASDAPRMRAASRVAVADRPKTSRERKPFGGLFGRRRAPAAETIVLPAPKRVEPPAEEAAPAAVLTMVRPEPILPAPKPVVAPVAPKPVAAAPKPVAPKPVSPRVRTARVAPKAALKSDGLVSKVERAMNDNEALIDTPATVLAMRLLNQRVRELDEKVQRLERELAAAKAPPEADAEQPRKRFGR